MTIKTALDAGVATIEIARPEKKNAITQAMYVDMAQALHHAAQNTDARAVLITGQPGVFTSGNDLEDFLQSPPRDEDAPVFRFMRALASCPKPVVAAVTGAAVGIGTTMLLHCDFVYVSDEARLAMPFVNLGLVPEFGASWLVPQRLGRARASELLLLGDSFTGAQAVEWGLAAAVLPPTEVLRHARRVAERVAALPAGAVQAAKQLCAEQDRSALMQVIAREAEVFGQRLRSAEAREAFTAFFEKRAPDFAKLRASPDTPQGTPPDTPPA